MLMGQRDILITQLPICRKWIGRDVAEVAFHAGI
jgi:hypothetical protein